MVLFRSMCLGLCQSIMGYPRLYWIGPFKFDDNVIEKGVPFYESPVIYLRERKI